MRLNRFLAAAGFGSRRACEALILDGKVSINGHFIRDLATQVEADDDVRVGGKPARVALPTYILLYKPKGILCTCSDERDRTTILDFVPPTYGRLFHVGRLDMDSEGLILLTNDGALSQKLTHPAHEVDKEYLVTLDKAFDPDLIPKLTKGFHIEEGRARMERVYTVAPNVLRIVLRQGLKRQIRTMLYRVGYEVKRLVRVRIGNLEVNNMRPGEWRPLQKEEVAKLTSAASGRPRTKKPVTGRPDTAPRRSASASRRSDGPARRPARTSSRSSKAPRKK